LQARILALEQALGAADGVELLDRGAFDASARMLHDQLGALIQAVQVALGPTDTDLAAGAGGRADTSTPASADPATRSSSPGLAGTAGSAQPPSAPAEAATSNDDPQVRAIFDQIEDLLACGDFDSGPALRGADTLLRTHLGQHGTDRLHTLVRNFEHAQALALLRRLRSAGTGPAGAPGPSPPRSQA
jgi:hypothetical protein